MSAIKGIPSTTTEVVKEVRMPAISSMGKRILEEAKQFRKHYDEILLLQAVSESEEFTSLRPLLSDLEKLLWGAAYGEVIHEGNPWNDLARKELDTLPKGAATRGLSKRSLRKPREELLQAVCEADGPDALFAALRIVLLSPGYSRVRDLIAAWLCPSPTGSVDIAAVRRNAAALIAESEARTKELRDYIQQKAKWDSESYERYAADHGGCTCGWTDSSGGPAGCRVH